MSYDTKCHDLAVEFLTDEPNATEHDAAELAQVIQDAIEDFINYDIQVKAAEREKLGEAR